MTCNKNHNDFGQCDYLADEIEIRFQIIDKLLNKKHLFAIVMQTISVRTTQNVFIDYPIASLGDRMVAYLIDAIILTAYNVLCYFVLDELRLRSVTANLLIVFLPFFLYHPMFEMFMNGQTPGKRQMRIKVVSMEGTSPTIGGYLLRWIFRLVEVFTLRGALAMVAIAMSGKGQRLGDMVAGTTVVKLVPEEAVTAEAVFTLVEEDHEPVFNQVTQLSDYDIELMQQALTVSRETGNAIPVTVTMEKLKAKLGIETDMPPVKFLYTVIKDYSFLTSYR